MSTNKQQASKLATPKRQREREVFYNPERKGNHTLQHRTEQVARPSRLTHSLTAEGTATTREKGAGSPSRSSPLVTERGEGRVGAQGQTRETGREIKERGNERLGFLKPQLYDSCWMYLNGLRFSKRSRKYEIFQRMWIQLLVDPNPNFNGVKFQFLKEFKVKGYDIFKIRALINQRFLKIQKFI